MRKLISWFVELDRILKGEATRISDLRDASIEMPVRGVTFVLILLGMLYGICMGCYALVNHDNRMQLVASMVKVPALFFLTLLVTLPSLYVFNALVGSRLTVGSLVKLFVASLGVNLAVLSSLGPIVAFFSVNTATYGFMVLLNVLVFVIAGLLGLSFLLQTLQRLHIARYGLPQPYVPVRAAPFRAPAPAPAPPQTEQSRPADGNPEEFVNVEVVEAGHAIEPKLNEPKAAELSQASEYRAEMGPLEAFEGRALGRRIKLVFTIWMFVFGLVGAQMSWILRPFVGSPDIPFQWFRPRGSNFFEAVAGLLQSMFGG